MFAALVLFATSLLVGTCLGDLKQVTNLPGYGPPRTRMLSGSIVSNATYGSSLFMVLHESMSANPLNDPLVVWLQGGPGCSSMFACFVENGPYLMDANGNLTWNKYTWINYANMLFIDSPPGTGFSTTNSSLGYDTTERAVALDLYNALQGFFRAEGGRYRGISSFFIAGESYAGKYVPFLAAELLNKTAAPGEHAIPLRGILMGNAWTDPRLQMMSYVPYLQLNNLISPADAAWAQAQYPVFNALLDAGQYVQAANLDNQVLGRLTSDANIGDPYNIDYPTDPTQGAVDALTAYLLSPTVQSALNVVPYNPNYTFCASQPYGALALDEERDARWQLRWVLNNNVQTTLYNGERDLICDWIGTLNYSNVLGFNGQALYASAPVVPWYVPGNSTPAGSLQHGSGSNLVRATIAHAGHMCPSVWDAPAASLELFRRSLFFDW